MQLDRIITDPIISTENASFTPSSASPSTGLPFTSDAALPSERDPLVGASGYKKPFFRARPLWLVPFALTTSILRGMTLAPRVEVFTELSCRQFHDHYNHTFTPNLRGTLVSDYPQDDPSSNVVSLYLPLNSPPVHSLRESKGDGVNEGDDPRVIPGRRCVSDPAVQAGAVKLQTIMTTTMGALSAFTTGWWGHFGERHGRTSVLALSTLGLFFTDLIFILVSTPHNLLATHSHKLLILAPIIEGLLGGWSSLTGATTSYIADCTSPGSRATVFARFSGVVFGGLALGPVVGAWLIRNPIPLLKVGRADHPLQSVNSVFWVAIFGSFLNLLVVFFALPESLPASRRAMNRNGKNRAVEGDEVGTDHHDAHAWGIIGLVKRFMSPLAVFLPADVPVVRPAGMLCQPLTRKDWSMTFLAFSVFVYELASGVFQVKYLYAEHIYGWAAEQLSYYVSFMGAVRAVYLLTLLPFLLVTFKPVRTVVSSVATSQLNSNGDKGKPKPTKSQLFSDIRFDALVIRYSMFIEFCSHALVVLAPLPSKGATSVWWSQLLFVGATSFGCTGAGVMPAVQSLALSTLQCRKLIEKDETARLQDGIQRDAVEQDSTPESGQLFGAIAVLNAISQAIIGPITFAMIYSNTVASFPKAVFVTAAALVMVAMILTMFVRPDVHMRTNGRKGKSGAASKRKVEVARGRSRVRKDLRGVSASSYGATRHDASVSTISTMTIAGSSAQV